MKFEGSSEIGFSSRNRCGRVDERTRATTSTRATLQAHDPTILTVPRPFPTMSTGIYEGGALFGP